MEHPDTPEQPPERIESQMRIFNLVWWITHVEREEMVRVLRGKYALDPEQVKGNNVNKKI